MKVSTLTALSIATLTGSSALGAITYIDADFGTNTTLADGTAAVEGTHFENGNVSGTDDKWDVRAFANGGTIISAQNGGSGGEDPLNLRTTISGLTPGAEYHVYAYFWSSQQQGWRGRASLTDPGTNDPTVQVVLPGWNSHHFAGSGFSPMTELASAATGGRDDVDNPGPVTTADGSGFENGGRFTNTPLIVDTTRYMIEAPLTKDPGTLATTTLAVADINGEIQVYIGHGIRNSNTANRTWYDGVGYELVPEPSSLALLGLGGLLVARRRRG